MRKDTVFCSIKIRPLDDKINNFLASVKIEAPARFKDPDVIRRYCDDKRAELSSQASRYAGLCEVTSASIIYHWNDTDGSKLQGNKQIFVLDSDKPKSRERFYRELSGFMMDRAENDITVVGVDIRNVVKVLGLEAAATGHPLPAMFWRGGSNRLELKDLIPHSDESTMLTVTQTAGIKELVDEVLKAKSVESMYNLAVATGVITGH